jgi:hypothetical protein
VLAAAMPFAWASPAPGPLAIDNVTLLTMQPGVASQRGRSVLVRDGRIAWIGAFDELPVDASVRRIDASGGYLLPALADMHVHFENDRLLRIWRNDASIGYGATCTADLALPYVANGILQIANFSAMSESIGQRADIESGRVLGPHMALGAMIDGEPSDWPLGMTRVAATPADGRQAVRDAKAEGYDFIKVYNRVSPDTFRAVVEEARRHSVPVAGHLIARGAGITSELFLPGFTLVAHLQEYAQQVGDPGPAELARFATVTHRNGTAVVTTLEADQRIARIFADLRALDEWPNREYVHPLMVGFWLEDNPMLRDRSRERVAKLDRLAIDSARTLRALQDAGVTLLAGTDTPLPGQAAGFALHDELQALVEAGMSAERTLHSATREAARWLGVLDDRGTLEVGKRADLLLVAADPLEDIRNTRRIRAVVAGGRYLTRRELDAMLEGLAARYRSHRGSSESYSCYP